MKKKRVYKFNYNLAMDCTYWNLYLEKFLDTFGENDPNFDLISTNLYELFLDKLDITFNNEFALYLKSDNIHSRNELIRRLKNLDSLKKIKEIYINNLDSFNRFTGYKSEIIGIYLKKVNSKIFDYLPNIDSNISLNKLTFLISLVDEDNIIIDRKIDNDSFYEFITEKLSDRLCNEKLELIKFVIENDLDFSIYDLFKFISRNDIDPNYIKNIVQEKIEFLNKIFNCDNFYIVGKKKFELSIVNSSSIVYLFLRYYENLKDFYLSYKVLFRILESKNIRLMPFMVSILLFKINPVNKEFIYSDFIKDEDINKVGRKTNKDQYNLSDTGVDIKTLIDEFTKKFNLAVSFIDDEIFYYKKDLSSYENKIYNLFIFVNYFLFLFSFMMLKYITKEDIKCLVGFLNRLFKDDFKSSDFVKFITVLYNFFGEYSDAFPRAIFSRGLNVKKLITNLNRLDLDRLLHFSSSIVNFVFELSVDNSLSSLKDSNIYKLKEIYPVGILIRFIKYCMRNSLDINRLYNFHDVIKLLKTCVNKNIIINDELMNFDMIFKNDVKKIVDVC